MKTLKVSVNGTCGQGNIPYHKTFKVRVWRPWAVFDAVANRLKLLGVEPNSINITHVVVL